MLDVVLLPAVQINRFFVHENQCARKVNFADNVRFPADVDDHEIVACDRAKAHGVGRIGFLGPVIILAREMQKPGLRKPRAKIRKVHVAELFTGGDRQFKSRAFQVIDEDFQIVRLNEGVLGRVTEEVIRVAHHELIERRG